MILYCSEADLSSVSANAVQITQTVLALQDCGNEVMLTHCSRAMQGTLIDLLRARGIQLHDIGKKRSNIINAFQRAFNVLKLAKKLKAPPVYGRFAMGVAFAKLVSPVAAYESHRANEFGSAITRLTFQNWILKRCVLVCHNQALADHLMTTHKPNEVHIIYSGSYDWPAPKLDSEHKRKLEQLKERGLVSGFVGGVSSGKGFETVLKLALAMPDMNFVILGADRPDSTKPNNLHFFGRLSPVDLGAYISEFDVCLSPHAPTTNAGWGEIPSDHSAPLKVFDYMRAGKTMIVSRFDATEELITHGETGFLLDHDDVEAWKRILKSFADEPKKLAEIGDKARSSYLIEFSSRKRARRIESILGLNPLESGRE